MAHPIAGVAYDLEPCPLGQRLLQLIDAGLHEIGHGRRAVLARFHDVEPDRLTTAEQRRRRRLGGPCFDIRYLA